ncbi:hypothetical protein ACFV1W_26545 [Kitasatospora sp. NPDC059648]|uniref:hypothetical protein n=1 Tax=Kitasatospora sp. NPDC059648 TaxID=3346894 RepID=UPI0036AF8425
MPEFDHSTLAFIDDDYDERHGHSRFGLYLDENAAGLDDSDFRISGAEFAALVWTVATAPTMSPGYVRIRPDLLAITANPAEDDPADLVLRITAPLPHRVLNTRPGKGRWLDWEKDCHRCGPWSAKVEPIPGRQPVLTLTADILLPIPAEELTVPATPLARTGLTRAAKRTVARLAGHINRIGGPAVAALLGDVS